MYLIKNIFLLLSVENLWIYAVVGFVLTGGFVIILICYCCCYRSRKSRRQMNHLPSNKVNTLIYTLFSNYELQLDNAKTILCF